MLCAKNGLVYLGSAELMIPTSTQENDSQAMSQVPRRTRHRIGSQIIIDESICLAFDAGQTQQARSLILYRHPLRRPD